MEVTMRAIEVTGTIDERRRLHLDEPLPIVGPSRVRVLLLLPEEADIDEREWLRAAATIIKEFGLKLTPNQFAKIMYYIYRDFIGYNEIEGFLQWINNPQGLGAYIYNILQQNDQSRISKLAELYNELYRLFYG